MGCTLLPGIFDVLVQGVLFLGFCCILLLKKHFDEPPRSWKGFLADCSKQICGVGWIHVVNSMSSWKLQGALRVGDECAWYWVNIIVDCSLGVVCEYIFLAFCLEALSWGLGAAAIEEFRGGHYYERDVSGIMSFHWRRYFKQLGLWFLVVTQMKICITAFVITFQGSLLMVAAFTLGFFDDEKSKLVVVKVITPSFVNSLQFWLVDSFLKRNSGDHELVHSTHPEFC